MDQHYYLTILIGCEGRPSHYLPALAAMREHAGTRIRRALLQEHGHLLIVTDAVQHL